jgi:type 1 fimbriae regulatory protein FimB
MDYLEKGEMLKLLRAAKAGGPREHAMVLVGYVHGCRADEVCGLRMEDVDLQAETVIVRRLKGSKTTTQSLQRYQGEPLLDEVKALAAWFKVRGDNPSPYVFVSQKGPRLHRQNFWRIVKGLGERAGVDVHPHSLKHSLATHLVQQDVNLAKVQQAVGHSDIRSTMIYVKVSDKQASDARSSALMSLYR